MPLREYRNKRNFKVSPEPSGESGGAKKKPASLIYVVQKHRASHLHYDFRLEWNGTLLSWAVPKGPSLDPAVKRLAMQVEDHPVEYANFEGVIPEGEYGGGTVMVWDKGTWEPEPETPDVDAALVHGELKFVLYGKKLKGSWVLVRTRAFGSSRRSSWLLIKHRDAYVSKRDIALEEPYSVLTHRLLADIARDGGGDVEKAATGDPPITKRQPRAAAAKAARPAEAGSVRTRTSKKSAAKHKQ
jgi:bifunctional non-homologous end joining protein LigD